ncbi:MAG: Bax inhibitor-1/YccA family protein, partial [Gammaproteobacteria bacterium]
MALRSHNPVLRDKVFQKLPATGEPMTINGTLVRSGLLLVLLLITGTWTWSRFMLATRSGGVVAGLEAMQPFMWGGLIVGFILAMACAFKPNWTPVTAPLYALAEGTFLGAISAMFEVRYHGIVLQAVMASVGVLVVMLFLYRSGVIKVTQKFRMGVFAATGGILLLYLVQWGISAFTSYGGMSFVFGGGTFGILFSIFVVCIAALNLV